MSSPPVVFDRVTAGSRRTAPCFDVSFTIVPGSVYALVGREASGKATVLRCLRGELRPKSGRVLVFGLDARRDRRALRKRVLFAEPGEEPPGGLSRELVVLQDRFTRIPGATVLLAMTSPALAAGADRVGFLRDGRLLLDEDVARLVARFRRIRYVNEITETRTDFGNELDSFDAVRVRVRGWGVDAVVSNFDDGAFERFRAIEGVTDARAEPMSLEEIFEAVVGKLSRGI